MKRYFQLLFAVVLLASQGCGEPEMVETKQSAVSSISSWSNLTGVASPSISSPTFARPPGGAWVVYQQGGDSVTYMSTETPPGSGTFRTTWNAMTGSDSPWGGAAVAVLTNYNPPRFIVAITGWDNQVHVQVQDVTGANVYVPWHVVSPGSVFFSAPSISFNGHPGGIGKGSPTLMIVARGTDDRVYFSKNVLASGVYSASAWGVFSQVSPTVYSSRPAVVEDCGWPTFIQSHVFIAAARLPSDGSYQYYLYDGLHWGPVFAVNYGLFTTGPALACALGPTSVEISIWGLGLGPNYQIWYSTEIGGGPAGFTVVPTQTLNQSVIPSVAVSGQQLRLGAIIGTLPATATATSPTSP